ncbi:imidazolonepropionase [Curvibacter sp. CHRR-16]|uniref:imidazolonepropionase n=1 Tax=Curvibacter sp. CHRR-16 TaxID=2835872 RepID=UPI001BD93F8D|nr:imidazolonepropionase [Curvibacter sp. CHRR-16]MBT0570951.1 imidazolonepropionase [Curvibacter sp. CHRR-16]
MTALHLWHNATVCTLTPAPGNTVPDSPAPDWGLIPYGAVVTEGDTIRWVGAYSDLPAQYTPSAGQTAQPITAHDLGGALLTPGLVDCHTHLVYGGHRANEAEMRLQGASYEQIARAGGGIRSTVQATRSASETALLESARKRLLQLAAQGVTTVEIKSGYGLSLESEARSLRVARAVGSETGLTVRTTYLGAHALPPEYAGTPHEADAYIDAVCTWLHELHAQGLVDAVDAFCETIGFSPAQTERVFATARALGLPVKLHAEQLSNQEGAALAARYQALSCDHLEYLSDSGIAAMRAAGTVAVLLPGAFYALREKQLPPIDALRRAGVPMAVATDHNPGTSPTLSLPLMLHMACTLFRLTPLEAVLGATVHAARALGLHDRGQLAAGQRADMAVWQLQHPNELAYWFGNLPCQHTIVGGQVFHPAL